MASTSLQGITSSPSSSPPEYIYDVFLSFRGKDTRHSFTSHLYSNLVQRGIDVYIDDRELERGKTIEPALWKAIEESRFSVVVFSRNYASSPWCLDELVKIVQCMKEMGHTVLPVFYDVDPSLVAEQKGRYEKAFVQHEENFKENLEKFQSWKDCLTTVANLSGWDVRNRNESESIKIIVEHIFYKLNVTMPTMSKNLVGIDSRLEVLNGYIGEEVGEAIFIGVCGMGGIGKTTIARVVYDRIRWQFEGSCFLANVKEAFDTKDGPRRLQEQLLSEILMERATVEDSSRGIDMIRRRLRLKKILLILDDVDDQNQLAFLAAERGWFGPGSRIIITSRNKRVLTRYDDARIYEAEKLNDDDALMLFSQKAFKNYQLAEDFVELSKQVVCYANGLPLALNVIGSFLHGRGILDWGSAIDRLNEIPDRKIINVLRISFDGLHELEKKIFLDIACFMKGFKKDRMIRILDGCGLHANIGTQVLIEKSLISVSRDQVWMHNLLQKMGKEIVRLESPEERGRRSRLWTYEDVCLALMDNTGKQKVEAIFLDMPGITEAQWNMEAFSKLSKLRLLKINNVQLSKGPEDLSNMLRFLEWHFYPSKSLPAGLQVDELVELHMPNSSIEQLWYGHKDLSNPRPGCDIVVPGNEIPGWFNHQKKGSSISVEVHSWSMGFVACVAFSASGESPSLSCHLKANGRENYPLPMGISCNSIQVLLDHLWLFYLSFDYLKELKEWQHESFNNIELSFHSSERVKVKNCGLVLLYSLHTPPSSQSSASFTISSMPDNRRMQDDIHVIRDANSSDAFTHLSTAVALRSTIPDDKELKKVDKVMAIRSRLLKAIEESRLSVIIFARDCASLTWCFDEAVKMVRFMDEIRLDTVFPVSYQTGRYTIVIDKDEENCRDNAKVKRWMNILTGVENNEKFGLESWKSIEGSPQFRSPRRSLISYRYFMLRGQSIWQQSRPIWQKQSRPIWQKQFRWIPLQRWLVQPLERFQKLELLLQKLRQQPCIHIFLWF